MTRTRIVRPAGLAALLLSLLVLVSAMPNVLGAGPDVADYWHSPKYPQAWEIVALNATVTDPDGVVRVDAIYCYYPEGICSPPTAMSDDDGDGVWGTVIGSWDVDHYAYYYVIAEDGLGESTTTEKRWFSVVSSIIIQPEATPLTAEPGDTVYFNGTATYDGNASLPVESSETVLLLEETMESWTATTDSAGAYAISVTAPAAEGAYHYRLSISNKSISASANVTLAAFITPRPDLRVQVVRIPGAIVEGQLVTCKISVVNVGGAPSLPTTARFTVRGSPLPGSTVSVAALDVTEALNLSFDWIAERGSHTLVFEVDPGDSVSELDESNNVVIHAVDVARDTDGDGVPDSDDSDDDNDGIPDEWETQYGLDPLTGDGGSDADGDGLTNLVEFGMGTNPRMKDTDGDGYTDMEEEVAGTDPTLALDSPRNGLGLMAVLGIVLAAIVADVALLALHRRRRRE